METSPRAKPHRLDVPPRTVLHAISALAERADSALARSAAVPDAEPHRP